MSIFRRETTSAAPAGTGAPSESASSQRRRVTHVAPGTRIHGEITGSTELLVDGELLGEVRVEAPVTVGADGVVEGAVSAPVVRVGGRVVGDVQATDRVEVLATGSVEGDIVAPRIVIAEGAFFKGRVRMKDEKAKGARTTEPGSV
jgi:cytoskeletal protein CcmA (bactofilin family)